MSFSIEAGNNLRAVVIEASSNMVQWVPVATNYFEAFALPRPIILQSTVEERRFYRAVAR
jgi:hypothetical protein